MTALYPWVRWAMARYHRWNFREVAVQGLENVPGSSGGVLVSWHPNSLMDPGLIFVSFPRTVVFGARHGLFRIPLLGPLMTRMGAVPLYRSQDHNTSDNARQARNTAGLRGLVEAVSEGRFVTFFPEGTSHDDPGPRPLKTGAARLLRQAWRAGPPPVLIPVVVDYDHRSRWLARAVVTYHPPIPLSPPPADRGKDRDWDLAVTARIHDQLVATACGTDTWEAKRLLHQIRRVWHAEDASRHGAPGRADMPTRTRALSRAWALHRARAETHPDLFAAVSAYAGALRRVGLSDHELDPAPPRGNATLAALLLSPLLLLGGLAHAVSLLLLWLLPRGLARQEANVASIRLLLGAVFFPLAWLATPAVMLLLGASGAAAAAVGLLAFLGLLLLMRLAVPLRDDLRWARARWRRRANKAAVAALRVERARLFEQLTEAERFTSPDQVAPG